MSVLLWVLLFLAIAVGGLVVLVRLALRVWRAALALLDEVGTLADRAGELADLLAQVEVVDPDPTRRHDPEAAWPGTVETYDDRGANAPGK